MRINGWDISSAGGEQWNVKPGFQSIANDSVWVRGSPVPVVLGNWAEFKTLGITLMVRGEGREAVLTNCSKILARLLEPARLELDGFRNRFYGILQKYALEENPLRIQVLRENRAAKLTVEVRGYEYGAQEDGSPYEESASGADVMAVTNPGNLITPAVVVVTPLVGLSELTITGICREPWTGEDLPVTIRNLASGSAVTLDGETGLMTEGGAAKAGDLDIWALPTLKPGMNTVALSSTWADLTVKFYPRYM